RQERDAEMRPRAERGGFETAVVNVTSEDFFMVSRSEGQGGGSTFPPGAKAPFSKLDVTARRPWAKSPRLPAASFQNFLFSALSKLPVQRPFKTSCSASFQNFLFSVLSKLRPQGLDPERSRGRSVRSALPEVSLRRIWCGPRRRSTTSRFSSGTKRTLRGPWPH